MLLEKNSRGTQQSGKNWKAMLKGTQYSLSRGQNEVKTIVSKAAMLQIVITNNLLVEGDGSGLIESGVLSCVTKKKVERH